MIGLLRNFLAAIVLVTSVPAHGASIAYGVGVVDFGTPSNFGFVFGTPIAPQTGLSTWSFSGSMTLVDATGDGVAASNGGLPEYWQLVVRDGSNVDHVIDDVGGAADLIGAGPFNFVAGGTFDCSAVPGGCVFLVLSFSFALTGNGDELTSSGLFEFNDAAVPEPATLLLLGLGLASLAIARRRAIA